MRKREGKRDDIVYPVHLVNHHDEPWLLVGNGNFLLPTSWIERCPYVSEAMKRKEETKRTIA